MKKTILLLLTLFMVAMLSALQVTYSDSNAGQDDGPTVSSVTFDVMPGTTITDVQITASIGANCPSWYEYNMDLAGTAYTGLCNITAQSYADLNGAEVNGQTVTITSVDNDVYSDGVTLALSVTVVYDPPAGAPGEVTNPSPADNATGIALSGNATWDFGVDTDTYDLWFGPAGAMVQVVTGGTAGATGTYAFSGLSYSTEYEWRVTSINSSKATTVGPVWSFTTMLDPAMVQIGAGVATNQHLPIEPYYGYTYSQSIYLASDFGTPGADKRIEKIWYNYSGSFADADSDLWVVYMGTTALTNLDGGYIAIGSLSQVFDGNVGLSAVSGTGWLEIVLDAPFVYNPATDGNLVIAVDENSPSYSGSSDEFLCDLDARANVSYYYYNDTTNPDPAAPPAGTASAYYPNTRFLFGDVPETPILTVNPASKDFGIVNIGSSSASQTFIISNTGAGTLNISSVALTGGDAAEFVLTDGNSYPEALTTGQSISVGVVYEPTTAGAKTAYLTITDDRATTDITLTGEGNDPYITAFPYTQNFDAETVPALPIDWTYLNDTGVTAANVQTSTSYANSAANSARLYNATAVTGNVMLISPPTALATGATSASFWCRTSSGDQNIIVGTMTDPTDAATFTPLQTVAVNATFAQYTVYLGGWSRIDTYVAFKHGMDGTYDYFYIDDFAWGNAPDYAFSLTTPVGIDLEIGASHDYPVTIHNHGAAADDFTPTIDGLGTWTYGLYEDDGVTPLATPMTIPAGTAADFVVKVTVPGTAVATDTDTEDFTVTSAEGAKAALGFSITTTAIPADPIFQVDPTTWDYGQVMLNSPASKQFTITNIGGGTLTINSITKTFTSHASFTFTENNAPVDLGPSESTTFTMQFLPTAAGTFNATVNINDSRIITPITLTGEGLDPTVTVPWEEDFTDATFPVGWTQTYDPALTSNRWNVNVTTNAGGAANEMRGYWVNASGISRLITPPIEIPPTRMDITLEFKHFLDDYGVGCTGKIQSSTDLATWTDEATVWTSGGGNVGPETVTVDMTHTGTIYLAFVMDGNHYQIDGWFVDDVKVYETPSVFWDLTMLAPDGPGTVLPEEGIHSYGEGSVVNLTARPALGFFDEWEVDGAFHSTDRIAPLTMDAAHNAQAFFSLPAGALAQGFNAGNPVPGEWTETATQTAWEYQDDSFFVNMFGGFTVIGHDINVGEEMLITPELTLDGSITTLAYWLAGGNNMVGAGSSTVQVKYQPVGAKVWTNIGSLIDLATNESLQYVELDLSAIPNGDYNFAFVVNSTFDYAGYTSWLGIDNVVGPVLASVQSNDLEVTSVSYQNDIIYEGNVAVLSAEITNVGLLNQNGTQVTFTVDDGRTTLTTNIGSLDYGQSEVVTVNYTTVGGRHTITAEVTADDNTANDSATTEGVVAVAGNLAEGFEGTVDGWAADADWALWNQSWLPPYEGVQSIAAGNAAGFAEAYLITPMLTIGAADELNFYASYGNQSTGPADLDIVYSADGTTWTDIVAGIVPNDFMELYTIDLSGITPGNYYIGFRASATGDGTYSTWINVDHVIGPELAPQTIDTPANFAIAMVGGIPQLSWDTVVGALSYNVYGGADPYGAFALVGSTDQLTYDLAGTEAYQFYHVTASTDALPPVMAAKRNIVVSKDAAIKSVSMIQHGSGLEHKVSAPQTTKDLRAPKGLK